MLNILDVEQNIAPIHLVIQGPIKSWSQKRKSDDLYDCTNNILSTIRDCGHEFQSIHIITWTNEPTGELVEGVNRIEASNVFLKKVSDPGRGRDMFGPLPDNRLRQYMSTLEGIQSAYKRAHDADLCLKIRTDQSLDLKFLSHELRSIVSQDGGKIVFPFALPYDLYSVADFYLGGRIDRMHGFFEFLIENISKPMGSRSVHVDLAKKYIAFRECDCALRNVRFVLSGKSAKRRGVTPIEKKEIVLWANSLKKILDCFPKTVCRVRSGAAIVSAGETVLFLPKRRRAQTFVRMFFGRIQKRELWINPGFPDLSTRK